MAPRTCGRWAIIVVDSREPGKWRSLADEVLDIMVDIIIVGEERRYAVERKTWGDLWKSIQDGRLWYQVERLRAFAEEGYVPILMVVGNPFTLTRRKDTKATLPKLYGALAAVMERGVSVVTFQKEQHAIMFVKLLDSRSGRKPREWRPPHAVRKQNRSLDDEAIDMLSMVTGVGPSTARRLLEEYGSVREVVNLPREELARVSGRAERIYDVVNHRYTGSDD